MMASFMRVSQKLVFHQSGCIGAIKHVLSTTVMYLSSCSLMYLRGPYYCDACLKSSALRVGVKKFHNTIHNAIHIKTFKDGKGTLVAVNLYSHKQ